MRPRCSIALRIGGIVCITYITVYRHIHVHSNAHLSQQNVSSIFLLDYSYALKNVSILSCQCFGEPSLIIVVIIVKIVFYRPSLNFVL